MSSFDEWYSGAWPRLVAALAVVSGGDVEQARDAAAEASARALARWGHVAGLTSPTGWAVRTGANVLRRNARRRSFEALTRHGRAEMQYDELPQPDVWRAVSELPERQRLAIALRYLLDFSEAEVAAAMGISAGAAAATLHKARTRLSQSPLLELRSS